MSKSNKKNVLNTILTLLRLYHKKHRASPVQSYLSNLVNSPVAFHSETYSNFMFCLQL